MTERFSFLASEAARVHVCGHRGYSARYPENTLPAFHAAAVFGATTVEADIVLTADAEPIILHDLSVDRTTDGHGFAAALNLEQIRNFDAGAWCGADFVGTRIPTVPELLDWATSEDMGLVLEIKEAERPELAIDRVVALLEATGTLDRSIVISFDHTVLKRALERHPALRTEAITHARHTDIVGLLRACGAHSVSIELNMFHPEDARALHEAGISNRLSLPRPHQLIEDWRGDIASRVVEWIEAGLIDSISGDDTPFLVELVTRAGRSGRQAGS